MPLLSVIKSYTPTLNADVLRMTYKDATNNTTKWQQTSITFLGYRALYANYPFGLLESVKEIQGKYYLSLCNFGIQCKLLHLLCCSQLYIVCLLKSPKQNICLPDSATLRSLLAVSTSPCITASTTGLLSLTSARAPIEDHNEWNIIKLHSQLSYITLYTL